MRSSYLKGITEPAVAADLKRVADLDLSVDEMGGAAIFGPTLRLSRLLPGLRIVIDHVPFAEWDADPAAMGPALDTWCELFGPERVVYGSNWPVSDRVARMRPYTASPPHTLRSRIGRRRRAISGGTHTSPTGGCGAGLRRSWAGERPRGNSWRGCGDSGRVGEYFAEQVTPAQLLRMLTAEQKVRAEVFLKIHRGAVAPDGRGLHGPPGSRRR